MLKQVPKVFLVATSLAPVFLTLAFIDWRQGQPAHCLGWLVLTLLIALSTRGLLYLAGKQLPLHNISIVSASSADREVIGFLIAYILPLALASGTTFEVDAWAIGYLVVLFGVVVWGTHSYDFNPLLGLLGYHFYEISNEDGITYVLITKRTLVSVRQVTQVAQLTEYVLLDKGP